MTLSLANELMSVPAAYRLYLPEAWASDRTRRRVAGVPDEVVFKTKTQIALDEIDGLLADGVAKAPIVNAAEMIQQRSGVTTPAWMMIRNRKVIAARSNEVSGESQRWWKDRGTIAQRAKPAATEQDLNLNRNWNSTSRRSIHRRCHGRSVWLT